MRYHDVESKMLYMNNIKNHLYDCIERQMHHFIIDDVVHSLWFTLRIALLQVVVYPTPQSHQTEMSKNDSN